MMAGRGNGVWVMSNNMQSVPRMNFIVGIIQAIAEFERNCMQCDWRKLTQVQDQLQTNALSGFNARLMIFPVHGKRRT